MESVDIRPSPIAGRWYSGDPEVLSRQLDGYIIEADNPEIAGEVVAVIAPHAGYTYSGKVAGHAFAAIKNFHPDIVIVLSPMHQPYQKKFLTSGHKYYWTPLGSVPVDTEAVDEVNTSLRENYQLGIQSVRNDEEHSLEIELPFLQKIYKHAYSLVPIMIRELSFENCQALGKTLFKIFKDKNVMMVISTDLSHFYTKSEAQVFDTNILDTIVNLDAEGVLRAERAGTGFACGAGAVTAGIVYARELKAKRGVILDYNTSYAETGDSSSVVGYGSAALVR